MSESKEPSNSNPQPSEVVNSGASLPQWSCDLQALADGPALDAWQVGDKYNLVCKGDVLEVGLKPTAQIMFKEKNDEYILRILNVQQSDQQQATFVVTGYKPGEYSQKSFEIGDGSARVEVKDLSWTVTSVIEGQMAQPYPSAPPRPLGFPVWVWTSLGVFAVVILASVVRAVIKYFERKRLYERMAKQRTALGPYNQLNKDLRILLRKYTGKRVTAEEENLLARNYLRDLEREFKMYLVRQLLVPATEWNIRLTMKEIKSRHRKIYKDQGPQIERLLREFSKASKNVERIQIVDCEQLANMVRHTAARIHLQTRVKPV